jgi:hypothetical protein
MLADAWYCANLKSVSIGGSSVPVSSRLAKGMASNSIVDSGTNTLNFDRSLLNAILGMLSTVQRQIEASLHGEVISSADFNLEDWPTLTFVLQGISAGADILLHVPHQLLAARFARARSGDRGDFTGSGQPGDPRSALDERLLRDLRRRGRIGLRYLRPCDARRRAERPFHPFQVAKIRSRKLTAKTAAPHQKHLPTSS